MDASMFLAHLRGNQQQRAMLAVAQPPRPAPPAAVAPPPPAAAATKPSGAKPQGHAGMPPFNSERYPAAFAGRPKGSKNRAPARRQMEASLAAAIAFKSGDVRLEADSTSPDFLEKNFGVRKAVVSRLSNQLRSGNMTMSQAVEAFSISAAKAGTPISGFSTNLGVAGGNAAAADVGGVEPDATAPTKKRGRRAVSLAEGDEVKPSQKRKTRALTNSVLESEMESMGPSLVASRRPVGMTPSSGGAMPGGQISSSVSTALVTDPVSTVRTPPPSLPSAYGAGSSSSSGVGEYPSLFLPRVNMEVDPEF